MHRFLNIALIMLFAAIASADPLVGYLMSWNAAQLRRDDGLWTPAEIETLGWYDASNTRSIVAPTGSVVQWKDKSGRKLHLTQTETTNQPSTFVETLNGRNLIVSDGNDFLAVTNFTLPSSGNLSMFVVARPEPSSEFQALYSMGDSTNGFQLENAGFVNFYPRVRTSETTFPAGPSGAGSLRNGPSTYHMQFCWTNNAVDIIIDGFFRSYRSGTYTNGPYNTKLSTSQTLRMFANTVGNPVRHMRGKVGEIVIIESCSPRLRQIIEGYLGHKWGIATNLPIDHPYKDEPPRVEPPVQVFLLAGQSNMLGQETKTSELPIELQSPQNDVLFYYSSALETLRPGTSKDFGPEVTYR